MDYDLKCGETARHFLGGRATDQQVADLAAAIQDVVEDWLDSQSAPPVNPDAKLSEWLRD